MKKISFFFLFTALFWQSECFSQVAINSTNAAANPSAMLDISSTNKGLLIPRLTTIQRKAIATPANGLMVFDTNTGSYWFNKNNAWKEIAIGSADNDSSLIYGKQTGTIRSYNMSNGAVYADSSGYLYDSGGPTGNYGNNENYKVNISNNAGAITLRLEVITSNLENPYDSLFILSTEDNGDILMADTLTGTKTLTRYFDLYYSVSIRFKSNAFNAAPGFKIKWDIIYLPKNSPSNILPLTGWYYDPSKMAMHGGINLNNNWSKDSSGLYSFNYGYGSKAKGDYSVALGHSYATGNFSTAMGNSTASGKHSTALGNNATASGNSSTALGDHSKALGDYSTAMGQSIALGAFSTAMGYTSKASGSHSTAMGFSAAGGNYSTAMGQSIALGDHSAAIGAGNAAGFYSTAIGFSSASGESSTAIGNKTEASGNFSVAIGDNTTAKAGYETVLGRYNTNITPASATGWVETDRLFTIGNGEDHRDPSDAMVILKNGNTGIGISNPDARLSIAGNTSMPQLKLLQASGSDYARLRLTNANGNTNSRYWDLAANIDLSTASNDRFHFYNIGHGNILSLTGNGNVGIGTVNPNYKLDVAGDINASGQVRVNGIALTSDERFKQQITNLPDALNNLLQLRGTSYFFNKEAFPASNFSSNKQIGLIAQEVEKIFPELVTTNGDGYKSVNYLGLIPVMIESIKDQQKQIAGLKKDYEELKKLTGKLLHTNKAIPIQ